MTKFPSIYVTGKKISSNIGQNMSSYNTFGWPASHGHKGRIFVGGQKGRIFVDTLGDFL